MARTVGIGHQDFEKLITEDLFYIDKTSFIKEWWENQDTVTLIARPRRFGKTLNLSMLEEFSHFNMRTEEIFLKICRYGKMKNTGKCRELIRLYFSAWGCGSGEHDQRHLQCDPDHRHVPDCKAGEKIRQAQCIFHRTDPGGGRDADPGIRRRLHAGDRDHKPDPRYRKRMWRRDDVGYGFGYHRLRRVEIGYLRHAFDSSILPSGR